MIDLLLLYFVWPGLFRLHFEWPGRFVRGDGGGIGVGSVCWGSTVACSRGSCVACVAMFIIFCYISRAVVTA